MGGGIVNLASVGKNHGSHLEGKLFLRVIEFDGTGGAKFFTGFTFAFDKVNTMLGIYGVFQGYRLGVLHMSRFTLDESCIVLIVNLFRTFFRAQSAGNAFFHVNIPGILDDFYFKVALFPGYVYYLGQCQQFNIDMPADLDQFGRNNSHGAVIGRKGLVQLGHGPTDG
jgi:hypothetical protein